MSWAESFGRGWARGNDVGAAGVKALAALKQSPTLEHLSLALGYNNQGVPHKRAAMACLVRELRLLLKPTPTRGDQTAKSIRTFDLEHPASSFGYPPCLAQKSVGGGSKMPSLQPPTGTFL